MNNYEKTFQLSSDSVFCGICGKPFTSQRGKHVGFPTTNEAVCSDCEMNIVIPQRLKNMYERFYNENMER